MEYLPWLEDNVNETKEKVEIYSQIALNHIDDSQAELKKVHMDTILNYVYEEEQENAAKRIKVKQE